MRDHYHIDEQVNGLEYRVRELEESIGDVNTAVRVDELECRADRAALELERLEATVDGLENRGSPLGAEMVVERIQRIEFSQRRWRNDLADVQAQVDRVDHNVAEVKRETDEKLAGIAVVQEIMAHYIDDLEREDKRLGTIVKDLQRQIDDKFQEDGELVDAILESRATAKDVEGIKMLLDQVLQEQQRLNALPARFERVVKILNRMCGQVEHLAESAGEAPAKVDRQVA